MSLMFLVGIALLPAIVLCAYVFKQDRVEKEPMGLLAKLFLLGAAICLPAALLEIAVGSVIDSFFAEELATGNAGLLYNVAENFIGIALIEEGLKLLVLHLVVRKSREFNCLFDGLIYSVFVSLGFAALENVLYVIENGIVVAVMRALLSVPGHMFFAVMMGYHYSIWHITDKAAIAERELKARGIIPQNTREFDGSKSMIMCLLVPVLAHGLYDFCCMTTSGWAMLLLLAFVVFMYVHCFGKIKKMSSSDAFNRDYVARMLRDKYGDILKNEGSDIFC